MNCEQVEQFIERGQAKLALREIGRQGDTQAVESVFTACKYLLRLGCYDEGVKSLQRFVSQNDEPLTIRQENMVKIWQARFFNLLGAPSFAQGILHRSQFIQSSDYVVAGDVLQAQFSFDQAAKYYQKALVKEMSQHEEQIDRIKLKLGNAFAGMKEYANAIHLVRSVVAKCACLSIKQAGILAIGEYFARDNQFEQAHRWLNDMQAKSTQKSESPEKIRWLQWSGFSNFQLGRQDLGLQQLREALELCERLNMALEAIWEIYVLLHRIGQLTAAQLKQLVGFPEIPPYFQEKIKPAQLVGFGSPDASCKIFLDYQEYQWAGKSYLFIPLELKLLAILGIVGPCGISLTQVMVQLWPDQYMHYSRLEGRLNQLIIRIKQKYNLPVSQRKGRVYLLSHDERLLYVQTGANSIPQFLMANRSFQAKAFAEFYTLNSTQTHHYLQQWKARGWIERRGQGKLTFYNRL